jgi:hypothetical protein
MKQEFFEKYDVVAETIMRRQLRLRPPYGATTGVAYEEIDGGEEVRYMIFDKRWVGDGMSIHGEENLFKTMITTAVSLDLYIKNWQAIGSTFPQLFIPDKIKTRE